MIKFSNEEDAAAIDEGDLYLKLVIMMKKQQQLCRSSIILFWFNYNKNDDNYCKVVIYNYFVLALIPYQIWL